MTTEIRVAAIPGGWTVQASFSRYPLVFRSGARAEQSARALARALAQNGSLVRLLIHDRNGRLAGAPRLAAAF